MKKTIVMFGLVLCCAAVGGRAEEAGTTPTDAMEKATATCSAPKGIVCWAREEAAAAYPGDHTDALGASGAAFRIHTLPRETLCPSTVSPRYGFTPMPPDQGPRDAISAVRQAKFLAEAGQFGEYLSGASAYDLWIALLEADDDSDLMREQLASHKVEDAGLPILNNYCFQALVHAREAAGPYLRRLASELEGEASRAVQEAATCYDGAAAALKAVGRAKWNTESRRKQALAMREAKEFEGRAAVLLGQALVP